MNVLCLTRFRVQRAGGWIREEQAPTDETVIHNSRPARMRWRSAMTTAEQNPKVKPGESIYAISTLQLTHWGHWLISTNMSSSFATRTESTDCPNRVPLRFLGQSLAVGFQSNFPIISLSLLFCLAVIRDRRVSLSDHRVEHQECRAATRGNHSECSFLAASNVHCFEYKACKRGCPWYLTNLSSSKDSILLLLLLCPTPSKVQTPRLKRSRPWKNKSIGNYCKHVIGRRASSPL